METLIRTLNTIVLRKLNYNYIEFNNYENQTVGVYMKYDIGKEVIQKNEDLYSALINFKLHFTEKIESEDKFQDETPFEDEILNGLTLQYEVEFTSSFNVQEEETKNLLTEELFKLVEPYCRNKVSTLLTESNRKVPDLPYLYSKE